MAVVFFKLALTLASGILGAWCLRTRLLEWPEPQFRRGAIALQLLPAVLLFVGLYVIGHQEPTADVPAFYVPAARAVLAGQVPFRDFVVSYAPGFAWAGAALMFVWNSGKVFSLFAIALNAFTLLWWHAAASASFDKLTVRRCTILYASSGQVLIQGLLGTNQTWVAAGLAASVLLIARDRSVAAGLVQAVAGCATKFLAYLFWPLLWICAPRRSKWLLAATLPTACVYGYYVIAGTGAALLYPLKYEAALISPGNLPYLLDVVLSATGLPERVVSDAVALVVLAAATVWLFIKAQRLTASNRQSLLVAGLALTGLLFMIFSKKSFTGYFLFVLYPAVLMLVLGLVRVRACVAFLLLFNVLMVVEPSLWFHLGGKHIGLRAWFASGNPGIVLLFALLDVALLASYGYLAWLSVRVVQSIPAGEQREHHAVPHRPEAARP
jgi:hypothetical protein